MDLSSKIEGFSATNWRFQGISPRKNLGILRDLNHSFLSILQEMNQVNITFSVVLSNLFFKLLFAGHHPGSVSIFASKINPFTASVLVPSGNLT